MVSCSLGAGMVNSVFAVEPGDSRYFESAMCFSPVFFIDRISGIPSLDCPTGTLVVSSANVRCSESGRRAKLLVSALPMCHQLYSHIADSPSNSALFCGGSPLIRLTFDT